MADDRIFQALASHDGRAEVRDAFAEKLFERLVAERRSGRHWSRMQLLLVAALLLALAATTAVVIGSRVVNVPDEDVALPALAAIDCMPAEHDHLPSDQVLAADIRVEGQSNGNRPDEQLVLHADGTLLTGRIGASLAYDSFPAARRLSAEGMALLIGAVEDSGLIAPGCHLDLLDSTPLRGVTLRFDDGRVGQTDWGQYGGFTRMLTDAERAAADTLVARLEDLSWLPASAWIGAAEVEQRPDQWVVTVGPPPAEIVLPTPEPAPSGIEVCALLSLDEVISALPTIADSRAVVESGREERGVTYATCFYGFRDGPGVTVLLRPGQVSEQLAAEIATTWLGPEAGVSMAGAARVWENACVSTDHVYCIPVVAVWRHGVLVLARAELISGRELVDAIVPMIVTSLEGGIR